MFHRGTYVWGGILILVGILLFLSNLGILVIDVWKVIVPSIVILIGILTIWGTTRPTRELEARSVQLPLEVVERSPSGVGQEPGGLDPRLAGRRDGSQRGRSGLDTSHGG